VVEKTKDHRMKGTTFFSVDKTALIGALLLLGIGPIESIAQEKVNYLEWKIRNDDLGEVSNWLRTGDDLGETYSVTLSYQHYSRNEKYRWNAEVQSTEFSTLNKSTKDPKDIFFNELNAFRVGLEKEFRENQFLISSAGLYHIQSNRLTPGATGEKYYWHKLVLKNLYYRKVWNYVPDDRPNYNFPFLGVGYGIRKKFQLNHQWTSLFHSSFNLQLASNSNFSGVSNQTVSTLQLAVGKKRKKLFDLEGTMFYQSNIISYQSCYLQMLLRGTFRSFAVFGSVVKPLAKNLDNPYVRYNDMEILFQSGLDFFIRPKRQRSQDE
jgi:hypothetical protein